MGILLLLATMDTLLISQIHWFLVHIWVVVGALMRKKKKRREKKTNLHKILKTTYDAFSILANQNV